MAGLQGGGPFARGPQPEWAYSSVVEHYVDIVGVASSILATPTIPAPPFVFRPLLFAVKAEFSPAR